MPALLYFYVEWLNLNAKLLRNSTGWNSTQRLKPKDISWEIDNINEKASEQKKKNLIVSYLEHIKPHTFKVGIF